MEVEMTPLYPQSEWIMEVDTEEEDEEDEEQQQGQATKDQSALPSDRPTVSLWRQDAVFLLVDFVQIYAVMLSIGSFTGVWPTDWVNGTFWTLALNVDAWEIARNRKAYTGTAAAVPSSAVGIDYTAFSLVVILMPVLLAATWQLIKWKLRRSAGEYYALRKAHWVRHLFTAAYVFYMPYGVVQARLCHCVSVNDPITGLAVSVMDVDNAVACLSGAHLQRLIAVFVVGLPLLIAFPVVLYQAVRSQVFSSSRERHDAYLRLKEQEYVQKVDYIWLVRRLYLLSSYLRWAAFFKPAMLLLKLALILCFALLQSFQRALAIMVFALISLATAVALRHRTFRVSAFHAALLALFFANLVNSVLLLMTVLQVSNALLAPPYLTNELTINNTVFFCAVLLLFFILELKDRGMGCAKGVWPKSGLPLYNASHVNAEYRMRVISKARRLLHRASALSPTVAPAHELSRYIHIVNACFRDAETEKDSLAAPLQDVLDELVSLHNHVAPRSIFASSVKSSTRRTAAELFRLMPTLRACMDRRHSLLLLSHHVLGGEMRLGLASRSMLKALAVSVFYDLLRLVRRRQRGEADTSSYSDADGLSTGSSVSARSGALSAPRGSITAITATTALASTAATTGTAARGTTSTAAAAAAAAAAPSSSSPKTSPSARPPIINLRPPTATLQDKAPSLPSLSSLSSFNSFNSVATQQGRPGAALRPTSARPRPKTAGRAGRAAAAAAAAGNTATTAARTARLSDLEPWDLDGDAEDFFDDFESTI